MKYVRVNIPKTRPYVMPLMSIFQKNTLTEQTLVQGRRAIRKTVNFAQVADGCLTFDTFFDLSIRNIPPVMQDTVINNLVILKK